MVRGNRRARCKLEVGLGIARQHREHDVMVTGQRFDLVEAVGPVGCAAQQAQHDELRLRQGFLGVEIDGEIVPKLQQVGEAERAGVPVMRPRQQSKLAVGG